MAQKFTTKNSPKRHAVDIRVLNQDFKIYTEGSSERAKKVAQFLDSAVKDVMKKNGNTQQFKALILAALNITEKYFTATEQSSKFKTEMSTKAKEALKLIENATSN